MTTAAVVKPRTRADRQLVNIAVSRMYDALPGAYTRALRLQSEAAEIQRRLAATDDTKLPERIARAQLSAIDLRFKILKETILDRCVPVLTRVDMQAILAMIPDRAAEAAVVDKQTDEEKRTEDVARLLATALARLSTPTNGEAVKPPLFLVRREADGAA